MGKRVLEVEMGGDEETCSNEQQETGEDVMHDRIKPRTAKVKVETVGDNR